MHINNFLRQHGTPSLSFFQKTLVRVLATHSPDCPALKKDAGADVIKGDNPVGISLPKRAEFSGKVRLGFIPDEWFLFFHSKTGVTGPYLFGLGIINYLVSKEIFVMEHEYYTGLSILVIIIYGMKTASKDIAASLDKEVDEQLASWNKLRESETAFYTDIIKSSKDAQWRAEGQKLLMDAKKENIAMQLEAAYRERCMHVYQLVKGRMDYQVKRYNAEARIQQKWMIGWILKNVQKSINADFLKLALRQAIQDLSDMAARVK